MRFEIVADGGTKTWWIYTEHYAKQNKSKRLGIIIEAILALLFYDCVLEASMFISMNKR